MKRARHDKGGARVGVAGCGFTARENHLGAIRAAGARVVAAFDPDRAAAERLAAAAGGGVSLHPDAAALAADRDLDVVLVSSPPRRHAEAAVPALAAGLDVLVEKPLALERADVERMLEARRAGGGLAAVGFNLRAHPLISAAREAIATGEIGALRAVTHTWIGPSHRPDSGWADAPGGGGALLWERGSHCVDLVRDLALAAGADLAPGAAVGPPAGPLTLNLGGNEVAAAVHLVVAPPAVNRVLCAGDAGAICIDLYSSTGLERIRPGEFPGSPGVRLRALGAAVASLPAALRSARAGGAFRASYREQWRAFLAARASDGPAPLATLEDGLAVTEALGTFAAAADSSRAATLAPGANR